MSYWILAYYLFTPVKDPHEEVKKHHAFLAGKEIKEIKGRIYISHDGINGQMSATEEAAKEYMRWLCSDMQFEKVKFKIHHYHEHVFPWATVKVRPQLVALDTKVDLHL